MDMKGHNRWTLFRLYFGDMGVPHKPQWPTVILKWISKLTPTLIQLNSQSEEKVLKKILTESGKRFHFFMNEFELLEWN